MGGSFDSWLLTVSFFQFDGWIDGYLFIYTRVEFGKDCPVLSRCNPFPAIGHRAPEKYIPLAANVECKHILNKAEP